MVDKMKFGVLIRAHQAEVHERPIPELGDNEVLIKQEACNICTTDYGQWMGLREHQPYPMAGGHEVSGIVVKKGKNVRKDLYIGDRVAYMHYFCGECDACRSGYTSDCINNPGFPKWPDGYYGFFGFADYNVKDAKLLIKMNKDLPPEQAGFLEPVSTVIQGAKRIKIIPGETVVVVGAGTMGLINAQVARLYGGRVIITEMMERKIEKARKLGFEDVINISKEDPAKKVKELTNGKGADVIIMAVGNSKANQQALDMLKKLRGKILFFAAGFPIPELKISSNDIHYRKMELIGTYNADIDSFFDAAEYLNKRLINVQPLIEESFPLEYIQKAFEIASIPGNYRVSVKL
ncbi:zinc-dependent alcohol dehydrogenase [Thermoanaerobacterium thermosaccharolyticum]|uniref:Zn-dependent alcohol dehydrogenase n=1 Tax=Thermoanaerobacterium thermosaccharolyticum M0795 TaxID=698948 RepID=L0IN29_THETR|nr:zinc-binding dehydrogenase [Thermoanaerobacterium thermosaccharolyticum]AGB19357.1 Zn-dependent alcohol dehydrogenase [Thermoanaerobacterium thermosaccharolyticum M0795]